MARAPSLGTPDKTKKYVFPKAIGRRVLLLSLAAAGVLTVLVFGLSAIGFERLVSPGPLASGHAPLDARCEQCHAHGRAADLRCERCHDAAGGEGWRIGAHRRFSAEISTFPPASTSAALAERRNPLKCAECHGDHRGRAFPLARVDDRQ